MLGPNVLGNTKLIATLQKHSPDELDEDQMKSLNEIFAIPEFNVIAAKRASKAAPILFGWLQALINHQNVKLRYQPEIEKWEQAEEVMQPKRAELQRLNEECHKAQEELR